MNEFPHAGLRRLGRRGAQLDHERETILVVVVVVVVVVVTFMIKLSYLPYREGCSPASRMPYRVPSPTVCLAQPSPSLSPNPYYTSNPA